MVVWETNFYCEILGLSVTDKIIKNKVGKTGWETRWGNIIYSSWAENFLKCYTNIE